VMEFTDALAAEHAAIFAYGVIGGRLDGDEADAARTAEAAHRSRRDALLLRLAERGEVAPVAAASYALPFPVAGADDARRLATLVEERVGGVWRAVLPAADRADRAEALDALVDAAIRATGWRRATGVEPGTVAFPGAP
jgi:Domain of unknown function (DUF4439)